MGTMAVFQNFIYKNRQWFRFDQSATLDLKTVKFLAQWVLNKWLIAIIIVAIVFIKS